MYSSQSPGELGHFQGCPQPGPAEGLRVAHLPPVTPQGGAGSGQPSLPFSASRAAGMLALNTDFGETLCLYYSAFFLTYGGKISFPSKEVTPCEQTSPKSGPGEAVLEVRRSCWSLAPFPASPTPGSRQRSLQGADCECRRALPIQ